MDKQAKDVVAVTLALRDLLTAAGNGELVGGRLSGAIADERAAAVGGALLLTLGTKQYRIHITEWNQVEYDDYRAKHYRP